MLLASKTASTCLQFGEVIAAADGPQRLVELRGFKLRCGENLADIAFPRMLQVEAKVGPAV